MQNTSTPQSPHQSVPGCWPSSIDANCVAMGAPRRGDIRIDGNDVYWLEAIPEEGGRMGLITLIDGKPLNILPEPFNIRSKVHEYGGAPYCLSDNDIYFVNATDQHIYRMPRNIDTSSTSSVPAVSVCKCPELRFADLIWHRSLESLIAVSEQHCENGDVENKLVRIDKNGHVHTLAQGADFYAYPRLNDEQNKLCWISWQHPYMPWDATTLHCAELSKSGVLENTKTIAGHNQTDQTGQTESIVQPTWGSGDQLFYISDRDNWWQIYQLPSVSTDRYEATPVLHDVDQSEYATPLWVFGMQQIAYQQSGHIIAASTKSGSWRLERINVETGESDILACDLSSIDSVCATNKNAYFLAGATTQFSAVYQLAISRPALASLSGSSLSIERQQEISEPQSLSIPARDNENTLHAFFYPAHNSRHSSNAPTPLIVLCHGGPTGQTSSELNFKIQYWTNRGFSVVDINYRGSTGFGRRYRQTLYKNWGIADVEDMVTVVDYLCAQGKVDSEKVIIKGSSAGGYTVLAALTFTDRFNAGVSLYGIGDLELLATDTHKFEKHYLDQLIGPYPEQKAEYIKRSPIHAADKLNCPLLLFQGLEDKVVPPNQARVMAAAVENKGMPVAHVEYENEGHGFRSPETVEHMLESELYFYQQVFGLAEKKSSNLVQIKNV